MVKISVYLFLFHVQGYAICLSILANIFVYFILKLVAIIIVRGSNTIIKISLGDAIHMTSEQRKELRYQRRKAKREAKLRERNKNSGTLEEVFSFDNMFQYGLQCCKNVGWKQSTQNFQSQIAFCG